MCNTMYMYENFDERSPCCWMFLCTVYSNGEMGLCTWFVVCDIGGTPCDTRMHSSLQYGRTPLMVASGWGHVECVKLLLDKGAHANNKSEVIAVLISDQCLLLSFSLV